MRPPGRPSMLLGLAFALACNGEPSGGGAGPTRPEPVSPTRSDPPPAEGPRPAWALAVHGGAGTPPADMPAAEHRAFVAALARALREGCGALEGGASSLDAVERAVRVLEDDPQFNAGRGAVFNHEGRHELDASIMEGRDLRAGAVAGVRTVRNPISLARAVMERTRHVLLAGEGAERFAVEIGMEPVPNDYFSTDGRRRQWQRSPRRQATPGERGTVGAVALDGRGDLAAATSTGGLTDKMWGRIGDSPVIGAGTYADNRSCAVSSTGTGEEFIRHAAAYAVSARMRLSGETLVQAAEGVVNGTLRPGDGGVLAMSRDGEVAAIYSTAGMSRGHCDANGTMEIRIWSEPEVIPEEAAR